MRVLTGTSGYSYKAWKGSFYPPDVPDAAMLGYYAERFPTVEINNTFYRMPVAATLERWAAQVPPTFTFVLKAPQRITHQKRLGDVRDDLAYFLDTAATLGSRLGPILFQLPPYLHKDVARLEAFLTLLPEGRRAAFEFRHDSWDDEAVRAALRARGAALCHADVDEGEASLPFASTAGWGYLRLRRAEYTEADLEAWAARVGAQPWDDAYVFFKHEEEGKGPRLAARFQALLRG